MNIITKSGYLFTLFIAGFVVGSILEICLYNLYIKFTKKTKFSLLILSLVQLFLAIFIVTFLNINSPYFVIGVFSSQIFTLDYVSKKFFVLPEPE